MKTYIVSIPIAGQIHVEVEGDSEEGAIKSAWNKIDEMGPDAGEVEWEFFETLTTGNVLHAPRNKIEATEVK